MTFELKTHQETFWRRLVEMWNAGADARDRNGVYWWGAPGAGKTHLAQQFCLNVPTRKVFAATAEDLVTETQDAIQHIEGKRTLGQLKDAIREAELVFLDDLGREREGYGQDVVSGLLRCALDAGVFALVTANQSPSDLATYYRGDEGLVSRLSLLAWQHWPPELADQRTRPGRTGRYPTDTPGEMPRVETARERDKAEAIAELRADRAIVDAAAEARFAKRLVGRNFPPYPKDGRIDYAAIVDIVLEEMPQATREERRRQNHDRLADLEIRKGE